MQRRGAVLAIRFALREMRGGLAGFRIFIACIALGVAAIAGVSSVARMAGDTIAREGQAILGGDIAFQLAQREATPDEAAFIARNGTVSRASTLRAMARRADGNDQTLIELKAVDGLYPLYGTLELQDGGAPDAALAGNGVIAEAALLTRLGLSLGDIITIGTAKMRLTGIIADEPDRLSDGLNWGPRVIIAADNLAATGLIQPGSLIRHLYRVKIAPGADPEAIIAAAGQRFPDAAWRIETRDDAAPGLQRRIDRLTDFLTLVSLTALMVGGIGVGNAVAAYLAGKRSVIATFRSLGASGGFVVTIYLAQIALLTLIGIVIGLILGAAIPFLAVGLLGDLLPFAMTPTLHAGPLALATLYGAATALAFALPPLGRARDVAPTLLFRGATAIAADAPPARRYLIGSAIAVLLLIGLAVLLAQNRTIAIAFVVGAGGAFVLLSLIARAIRFLARRAPATRSTELRLAMANIHRPGALTPSIVRSLGIGLTLLAALTLIDGNIRRELTQSIPERAPSFYFLDISGSALADFRALISETAPDAELASVPMLRGRIVALKGMAASQAEYDPEVAWVLQGDRGVTFAAALPANSTLVAGKWWAADYAGPPLVSIEAEVARGLRLGVGDTIEVNVFGRKVGATIANLRQVDWDSFAINFVMVFSPSSFAGAPYQVLATLTLPQTSDAMEETRILRAVGAAFPTATAIRVKEALDQVNDLLGQVTAAILAASGVTLVTAMLVLAGALSAGHRRRLYEAVILKTLGATRRRIVTAFALEYLILAFATALFAIAAGAVAAWYVLTRIMQAHFTFLAGPAIGVVAVAVVLTLGLGLTGTWRILAAKPAPVLRDL